MGKPKMLFCYLCGREYGLHSLPIHLEQCKKMWVVQESRKPSHMRRKLPEPPGTFPLDVNDISAYNEAAMKIHNEQALEKCPYCCRTFNAEAYMRHQNICTATKPFKPLPGSTPRSPVTKKPAFPSPRGPATPPPKSAGIRGLNNSPQVSPVHHGTTLDDAMLPASQHAAKARASGDSTARLLFSTDGPAADPGSPKSAPVRSMLVQRNGSTAGSHGSKVVAAAAKVPSFANETIASRSKRLNEPKLSAGATLAKRLSSSRPLAVDASNGGSIESSPRRATTAAAGGGSERPAAVRQSPRVRGNPPPTYVCYLCGHDFGSRSLLIHIAQCNKKWANIEARKPKHERKPLPQPPSELSNGELPTQPFDVQAFNHKMREAYEAASLNVCQICKRSFGVEVYERHLKICSGERARALSRSMSNRSGSEKGGEPVKKPPGYACYLCGQLYGTHSLHIHIPQCQQKFLDMQLQKPKSERRLLPPAPPQLQDPLPTDEAGIEAFNTAVLEYFNSFSLVPCPHCQRTFLPESLEKHLKACSGTTRFSKRAQPITYVCYMCGRQYGGASLRIHAMQCHERFADIEARKPAYSQRPLPPVPPELNDPLPTTPEGIAAFNAKMCECFNGRNATTDVLHGNHLKLVDHNSSASNASVPSDAAHAESASPHAVPQHSMGVNNEQHAERDESEKKPSVDLNAWLEPTVDLLGHSYDPRLVPDHGNGMVVDSSARQAGSVTAPHTRAEQSAAVDAQTGLLHASGAAEQSMAGKEASGAVVQVDATMPMLAQHELNTAQHDNKPQHDGRGATMVSVLDASAVAESAIVAPQSAIEDAENKESENSAVQRSASDSSTTSGPTTDEKAMQKRTRWQRLRWWNGHAAVPAAEHGTTAQHDTLSPAHLTA